MKMKKYEIKLDEAVSEFFEEIAATIQRPVEEILSDTLFKYVDIINHKISEITIIDDESL